MADLSRLSINQATTREQWSLAEAIAGYAAQGVRAIGIWRDKLAECGVEEARRLVADHGMRVTGLCRAGMFPAADPAGRRRAIDDGLRAVDEAAALAADCLVVVAGGLPPGSRDLPGARAMIRDALGAILPRARAADIPVAVEPLHPMYAADRSAINTLAQALDLCDELGDGIGIAIDVYHVWWDPDLSAQIARAAGRIHAYHVCDWRLETRDLLADRGMMGDGVIDLPAIGAMVAAAGYRGFIEVEIFSALDWWLRPPEEVVRITRERFRDFV